MVAAEPADMSLGMTVMHEINKEIVTTNVFILKILILVEKRVNQHYVR